MPLNEITIYFKKTIAIKEIKLLKACKEIETAKFLPLFKYTNTNPNAINI